MDKKVESSSRSAICFQPLTQAQLKFWTAWRLHPDRPIDSRCMRISWDLPLDLKAFELALNELVRRTDSLRLRFSDETGQVLQTAVQFVDADLAVTDFSDSLDPLGDSNNWLDRFTAQPIDLTNKIFSTALAKLGQNQWLWQFNQHHIATDFSSAGLLIQRLSELYAEAVGGNLSSGPEYPSYLDFVSGNQKFFSPRETASAPAHDSGRICPTIPKDRQSTLAASTRLRRRELFLGDDRLAKVSKYFGLQQEKSPTRLHSLIYNLFVAATAVLVARLARRTKITIGTPTHNRYLPDSEAVTGLFIRMLPLNFSIDEETKLSDVLAAVRQERRKVFAAARKGDEIAKSPFNVVVNHITTSMPRFYDTPSIDLTQQRVADSVGLDLSVTIRAADTKNDVKILFDVNEDVLGEVDMEDLCQAFLKVFDAFLEQDHALVSSVALTGQDATRRAEKQSQLAVAAPALQFPSIPAGFVAQSKSTPDAIAVSSPTRTVTYAEVEEKSRTVAKGLIDRGVKPGDFVALKYRRSVDLVIAMIGIMRSGAGICGIDEDIPTERAKVMIDETRAKIGIFETDEGTADWAGECEAISIAQLMQHAPMSASKLPEITPETPAYVMYTSGTSGVPKGIIVPHGSAARCIQWFHMELAQDQPISWAMASTLSFEAPYRIFASLISGGCAVIYPDPVDPGRLALMDVIEDDAVDAVTLTPSQLRLLLIRKRKLRRIKTFQLIGEQLTRELAISTHEAFGSELAIENWYGPTETTMATTRHRFNPDADAKAIIPVGKPAPGSTVHVLDAGLNPVPRGFLGELCIGGIRMSSGYLNEAEAAQSAFIPDPFRQTGTLYRTGDLGRIDEHGNLVHHGRIDDQVKVNGVRVELADVETAILRNADVKSCAIVATGSENVRLTAFFISDQEISTSDLRSDLAALLPAALIPTQFRRIDSIPLSKNGKVDRKILKSIIALDSKAAHRGAREFVAPSTISERKIAEIWGRVLQTDELSCDDNFFDIGGDSMSFVNMVLSVEDAFEVQFPSTAIDGNCTLGMLAKLIDVAGADGLSKSPSSLRIQKDEGQKRNPDRNVRRSFFERLKRRAVKQLQMRKLRANPTSSTTAVSPELLRLLRLSATGWPGESMSDDLPVLLFNRVGRKPPLIWCFNGGHEPEAMAKHLGRDQPIYALRSMSKVVADKTYRRECSEDLAKLYVSELIRLEPFGPYFVGGNCQGGIIAELIARLLMLQGQSVPQLSLLEFVPPTPYPGRIALFFGEDSRRFNPFFEFTEPQAGWRQMHKEVVWDIVPGDHAKYFDEPNAEPFLKRLEQRLDEAHARQRLPLTTHEVRIVPSAIPSYWNAGGLRLLDVTVANQSSAGLGPSHQGALALAGLWKEPATGGPLMPAGSKELVTAIPPGAEQTMQIQLVAPDSPGKYTLKLGLCQQGLTWIDGADGQSFEVTVAIE